MNLRTKTLSLVALGAVGGLAHAHTPFAKISGTAGGLAPLPASERFGISVSSIGDLDGDGIPDLAVGANNDTDGGPYHGAVYILFLNNDGSVKAQSKISDTQGNFEAHLDDLDFFGSAVAGIGDLDGDGVPDLAVGTPGDDDGIGGGGAVYLIALNPNGTCKTYSKICANQGGFAGILHVADQLGNSVAGIGDFNGDGIPDIAAGAFLDDDGEKDAGCVRVIALNRNGTCKAVQKISNMAGNLAPMSLEADDRFGVSVTAIGDLDQDGIGDICVGAFNDDTGEPLDHGSGYNAGAAYILFLDATGKVKAQQKIATGTGGFTGTLVEKDSFGVSVAGLADRNNDGIQDLAVGAYGDDDGGANRGAVWILNLNRDGTVLGNKKISDLSGKFSGILDDDDAFGRSLCELPDITGDGWPELMVGATYDDDGATDAGAVWFLELRARAQGFTVSRNGAGTNPNTFVEVTPPETGNFWNTTIDIATPGAIASFVEIAEAPTSGFNLSGLVNGELLVAPPYDMLSISNGSHSIKIPEDFTLVNQTLYTQGATYSPGHIQLTNALDITIGTF